VKVRAICLIFSPLEAVQYKDHGALPDAAALRGAGEAHTVRRFITACRREYAFDVDTLTWVVR